MDYNLPYLEKMNFASFQNGGFAQNGHIFFCFLTITQSILEKFMFSVLILVNGHIPHKPLKIFLSDSKWRLKFKMATNFQSSATFVLMKFFSKFLLNFACVENGEKLWRKFFHFGSRWSLAQVVGQKLFFGHNFGSIQIFFNLCFALFLCYQHANLMEEKFLKNS
jgi:hypothetical protein